jgi:AcrR family transcriptional regulator
MVSDMSPPVDRPATGGRGARVRILAAAHRLFGSRGINATGVTELCDAAHVSKRTLYQHFPSKDDVVVAYLAECEEDRRERLASGELAPRSVLLELFDALADGPRPLRGDPFAAAAVEHADPRHRVHRVAAAADERLAVRLGELAFEAGARDAERLGRRLALLHAGAAAQTVIADDAAPAAEARALAAVLLDDAID